jgi:hypothetical protein
MELVKNGINRGRRTNRNCTNSLRTIVLVKMTLGNSANGNNPKGICSFLNALVQKALVQMCLEQMEYVRVFKCNAICKNAVSRNQI